MDNLKNLLDMNALSMGWTQLLSGGMGVALPLVLIKYVEDMALGSINIGNANVNQIARGSIESLFDIWRILTVLNSAK